VEIIELPEWRLRGVLKSGLPVSQPVIRVLKPQSEESKHVPYCDRCASPIEFGAVTNGSGRYCSVECSLEGPIRPA
jgi:hypothetical protein